MAPWTSAQLPVAPDENLETMHEAAEGSVRKILRARGPGFGSSTHVEDEEANSSLGGRDGDFPGWLASGANSVSSRFGESD